MSQITLDDPDIGSLVNERVAAAVPQHVRMKSLDVPDRQLWQSGRSLTTPCTVTTVCALADKQGVDVSWRFHLRSFDQPRFNGLRFAVVEIVRTAVTAFEPDNQDITLPDVFQTVLELIPIPEAFSNNLGRTIDVIKPHRSCSQAATPNGPPEQFPRPMAMPPGERIYRGGSVLMPASIRRPAFNSSASLNAAPTSCRLVTETLLSGIGTGIARAGFPAKFTAAVFCRPKTCASKRAGPQKREIFGGNC